MACMGKGVTQCCLRWCALYLYHWRSCTMTSVHTPILAVVSKGLPYLPSSSLLLSLLDTLGYGSQIKQALGLWSSPVNLSTPGH